MDSELTNATALLEPEQLETDASHAALTGAPPAAPDPAPAELSAAPAPPALTPEEQAPLPPTVADSPAPATPVVDDAPGPLREPAAPDTLLSAAPPQPDQDKRRATYWRSILTGNPRTVPDEVRRRAGVDEMDADDNTKQYHLLRTINRSWAMDHLPRTREQLRADWPQERAALAGKLGVRDNELEVYLGLSRDEEDAPRRRASEAIFERSYMAGLEGKEPPDIADIMQSLSPTDAEHARRLASTTFDQGRRMRSQHMGLAQRLAHGLEVFDSIEEDAIPSIRVGKSIPDLLRAVDQLADMSEHERNNALYIASLLVREKTKDKRPAWLAERAIQAARRATGDVGFGLLQLGGVAVTSIADNAASLLGIKSLRTASDALDKRLQMLDYLRHFSHEELRPLVLPEEKNTISDYLITASEAVPSALLSFAGGAGLATLISSSVGDSLAAARQRSPLSDRDKQVFMGLMGGIAQTGIYMTLGRVGGKVLSNAVANLSRVSQAGIRGYSTAALDLSKGLSLEMSRQMLAGKVSNTTNLGLQELASRWSNTASNIDWQSYGDTLLDMETNLHEAAATLPYLLIGSGRLGLQHFRKPAALLGDGSRLMADWGISEAECQALLREPRVEVQSQMLQRMLTGSQRWSSLADDPIVPRALNLLKTDAISDISWPENAQEFLNLPPVIDPGSKPTARPARSKSTSESTRLAQLRDLRGEWALKAGVEQLLLPLADEGAPSAKAKAAPLNGPELFAQSKANIEQLAHRILLTSVNEDTMMKGFKLTADEWREHAQQVCHELYMSVATMAMSPAFEQRNPTWYQHAENFLGRLHLASLYRNKTGHPFVIPDKPDAILAPYVESDIKTKAWRRDALFKPVGPYMMPLQWETQKLMMAMPHMPEFREMLLAAHSPQEAAIDILSKQFELDKEELMQRITPYYAGVLDKRSPEERHAAYAKQFELYRQLTGVRLESSTGDDGTTYYRTRMPDGSRTPWHEQMPTVINELASHMGIQFMRYANQLSKSSMSEMMKRNEFSKAEITANRHEMQLLRKARESLGQENEPSKFDRMCVQAMEDLRRLWDETATKMLPGVEMVNYRRYIRGMRDQDIDDGVTPLVYNKDSKGKVFLVDEVSESTPLAVMQSRFHVYWQRMLHSGYVNTRQAADYLVSQNFITPEKVYVLHNPRMRSIFNWRDYEGGRDINRRRRVEKIITDTAQLMTDYCMTRFLATLNKQPVPKSVREWVAMAAFAPEPEDATMRGVGREGKHVRADMNTWALTAWANSRVAEKLRLAAPAVAEMRRGIKPDALFDPLIDEAFGTAPWLSYEQGWCYRAGGDSAVHEGSPRYWNLLRSPKRGWELLNDEEKSLLNNELLQFCRREPLFAELAAEHRNPVPEAINMLDDLLKEHPDMHMYSSVYGDPSSVRVISLNDNAPSAPEVREDGFAQAELTDPIGTRPGCAYSITAELPEFMTQTPHGRMGLALLDILRASASRLPHAYGPGIWWNGRMYGMGGTAPKGLAENYVVQRPLEPLVRMLRTIGARDPKDPLKACGVQLRGLPPELDLTPLLSGVSIYRRRTNPAHVYRLMPGNPNQGLAPYHLPYVVHSRHGVYVRRGAAVRTADQLDDEVMMPLHRFEQPGAKTFTDNGEPWALATCEANLNEVSRQVHSAADSGLNDSETTVLQELLMRLAEDSGFSSQLGNTDPTMLTMREAKALNMLRDIAFLICSPTSQPTLRRLRKETAALLSRDTDKQRMMSLIIGAERIMSAMSKEPAYREAPMPESLIEPDEIPPKVKKQRKPKKKKQP